MFILIYRLPFQSFLGFYGGGEGYFSHIAGAGSESPGPKLSKGYDLRLDEGSECGEGCSKVLVASNGSTCTQFADDAACYSKYSTVIFSRRAVEVVRRHQNTSQPLFLYLAFQAVHAPVSVNVPAHSFTMLDSV